MSTEAIADPSLLHTDIITADGRNPLKVIVNASDPSHILLESDQTRQLILQNLGNRALDVTTFLNQNNIIWNVSAESLRQERVPQTAFTLTAETSHLKTDFVYQVLADGLRIPVSLNRAIALPTIPTSLVKEIAATIYLQTNLSAHMLRGRVSRSEDSQEEKMALVNASAFIGHLVQYLYSIDIEDAKSIQRWKESVRQIVLDNSVMPEKIVGIVLGYIDYKLPRVQPKTILQRAFKLDIGKLLIK